MKYSGKLYLANQNNLSGTSPEKDLGRIVERIMCS